MRKARKRIVQGILAGCSLAMCLTVGALWMRSTSEMDQVRAADPYRQTTFVSANGELCVETINMTVPEIDPGVSLGHALPTQYFPRVVHWQFAGFGGGRETVASPEGPVRYTTFMVPFWIIFLLMAIPPVLYWDGRKPIAEAEGDPAPTF